MRENTDKIIREKTYKMTREKTLKNIRANKDTMTRKNYRQNGLRKKIDKLINKIKANKHRKYIQNEYRK